MRPFLMSYIPGDDRGQAALLPAVIEDYVAADAPVRVIDAFVDGLDVRGPRFGRSGQADPTLVRRRRCACEHPFGTIKRMIAGGRFLTRGLKKVAGEAALSVLAYNLIRAINLIGATALCARLA